MAKEARKRKRYSFVEPQTSSSLQTTSKSDTVDAQQPEQKRQQQRRSLFVRGLSSETTTEALVAHFSSEFPIKHGHAVTDPTSKTCKGYGFVAFADADDAQRAMKELDGSELLGRKIRLEVAEPRKRDVDDTLPGELKQRSRPSAAALEAKEKRKVALSGGVEKTQAPKLIVRNLPWSIKEPDQLAKLFRSYGKVKFATLPKKGATTLAGFGFVMLRGHKNAEKAVDGVNGKEVDGRTLAVDWAVEKSVWEGHASAQDGSNAQADDEDDGIDDVAEIDGGIDIDEDDEEDGTDLTDVEKEEEEEGRNDSADENEDDVDLDNDGKSEEDDQEDAPEDRSSTVFIRNVAFTTTDDDLYTHFRRFGPVRYARTVIDSNTERPRGTAFVAFHNAADAKECLKNAPRSTAPSAASKPSVKASEPKAHSILQDESADPSGDYTLQDRILSLSAAVDKSTAKSLTEANSQRRQHDKRRLYLLNEGTISASNPLHAQLPPSEAAIRAASLAQRKQVLEKNPSLHLSLTRLSLRNIPRATTSKDLKALARTAVVGFATDVKAGRRARLSREELARGADDMAEAERERKRTGKGIVKQAKIVFETAGGSKAEERSGGGRSRGYGFVEYYTHRAALMGLRWLNGHALAGGGETKKRLIVEFAIENAQVVQRRGDRERRAREGGPQEEKDELRGKGDRGNKVLQKETRKKQIKKVSKGGDPDAQGRNKDEGKGKSGPAAAAPTKGPDADKLAQRQRIINKKRAMRRNNKRAGRH